MVMMKYRPSVAGADMADSADLHEFASEVARYLRGSATHEAVRADSESDCGYNQDRWRRLTQELGLAAAGAPEHLGGGGASLRELAPVVSQTGAFLLPEPVVASAIVGVHALAQTSLGGEPAPELEAAMAGSAIVVVHTAQSLERGDGGLSGRLDNVVHGTQASMIVTWADSDMVAINTDAPGCHVQALESIDSTRRLARVDVREVEGRVLATGSRATLLRDRLEALTDVLVAAEHVGIMAHTLETVRAYITEREQFGRVIGSFQAIKHRMADAVVDLERSRSALMAAAAGFTDDGHDAVAVRVAAAVVTEAAVRSVHEGVQLHGGIGFTWEHSTHYYVRRVLANEALFGSAAHHRRRLADELSI